MDRLLLLGAWLGGLTGFMLCGAAVLWRILGYRWLANFELLSLLQAGIAAMVAGCFLMLAVLVVRSNARL